MRTIKFASEDYWPLVKKKNTVNAGGMSSSAWNNKTPLVSFSSKRASFAWSNVTQGNSITPDSKRKHLKPLKVGKSQFGPTLKKTRTKSQTLKIRLKPLGLVMKLSMGPSVRWVEELLTRGYTTSLILLKISVLQENWHSVGPLKIGHNFRKKCTSKFSSYKRQFLTHKINFENSNLKHYVYVNSQNSAISL